MFSVFFLPLIAMYAGYAINVPILMVLYSIMGLGAAGIGLSIMHDSVHGSFSGKQSINHLLSFSMNLIGGNKKVWEIQHNVLHHSFTNIHEHDDDINAPLILRFSPHAKYYKIQRYQHLYFWFFYGLGTISWVLSKDFIRMHRYYKRGFLQKKNEYRNEIFKMILWKVIYYAITLILPIMTVSLGAGWVIVGFLLSHFILGSLLSFIFQVAHVMPEAEFYNPLPEEALENDRVVHQILTTSNFAPNNKFLTWYAGGLNYQVEHHLFPYISHVHYPQLAPIVKKTAEEFGIKYNTQPTFGRAVAEHVKMLRKLGKPNSTVPNNVSVA